MVVEDERIVAFNLQQGLSNLGYEVPAVAATGSEALRKAREIEPDLVLMDIHLQGDIDGIEIASRLNAERPMPVVYLTAYSDDVTLDRARATQPYGYLIKPFSERELHATIQMALARREAESALRESEERLSLALDAARMGMLEMDETSQVVHLSNDTAELLGVEADDGSVTLEELLACVDEADREKVRGEIRNGLRDFARFHVEFRGKMHDGSLRWLMIQGKSVSTDGHNDSRVIGVLQDVTERKSAEDRVHHLNCELEQRVLMRTAELEASLSELDAFSYSVAHDLRAPVRAVVGFSQILIRGCQHEMSERNADYLQRVYAAGVRMNGVIDGLLALSRITRADLHRVPVNLSALAEQIITELKQSDPQRVVDTVISKDVEAIADRALMKIVMDNLLRNAWKFTSKTPIAKIEFGVMKSDIGPTYFVRDDGAGFDMTFADKLFGAFQRLHHNDDFEGYGIGLATVHRIVRRHGGDIWAEGKVEKGAAFYFTLQP